MSESASAKSTIVINAIAMTAALAVVSGYLPQHPPLHQLQALLPMQQAK